jgi:nucleotide-binding universal stress UspA family protein
VEFDIMEASSMLRRAKTRLEIAGCKVDRAEYVLGDTVDQICRYADTIDADQIVLGSHGRSGLSKLLMGSTSIKVLEHSHRPVTVHRNVDYQEASTQPARTSQHGFTSNTAI